MGIAYAGLGRARDAVIAGRRGTELLPVEVDAVSGPIAVQDLALIHLMIGDESAALEKLDYLLARPSWISVPLLRLDPRWKPLWDHPGLERLARKYDDRSN